MHRFARHLSKVDPKLGKVIAVHSVPELKPTTEFFRYLVESILSQQLSVKASDTIIARFKKMFGRKKFPTPKDILATPAEELRSVGISGMKVNFLKDLSAKILDKTLQFKRLSVLSDEEVISHLTQVKGIGPWTAEMFLMFALARPDVFSYGDLGLKNAMKKIYKLPDHPTLQQAERISAKWKPYRTYAARYLWKSLDNTN